MYLKSSWYKEETKNARIDTRYWHVLLIAKRTDLFAVILIFFCLNGGNDVTSKRWRLSLKLPVKKSSWSARFDNVKS